MPERFPALEPVRVRGAGASHAGPRREHNDDAFGFFEDAIAALAVVVNGMGTHGAQAARCVVETAESLFRGRANTVLDDLAETWWLNEHAEQPSGGRVRPFSTLPIRERVELRDRVRALLDSRMPETIGDAAVLEGETQTLLGIGARALERANAVLHRMPPNTPRSYAGVSACAAVATFAAGRASIAHVGDCRVLRVRDRSIEALTTDHTIDNDAESLRVEHRPTPEQLEGMPRDLLTRTLGPDETVRIDTLSVAIEPGDLFLVATDGLWRAFSEMELLTTLRSRRTGAAEHLIDRGKRERPDHPGDDLTAVVVEIV